MKNLIFSTLLLLTFSAFCFAQQFTGKVVDVMDGRTLVIEADDKTKFAVQLQFVEVPPDNNSFAGVAKEHLRKLSVGKTVTYSIRKIVDTKNISKVLVGGIDLSKQLLLDGAVWYSVPEKEEQYQQEREVYQNLERQAKTDKRGIWSLPDLKPSWVVQAEIEAANEEKRRLEMIAKNSREAAERQREKDREIAEALARAANEEKRRLEIEAANEKKRRLEIEAANEEKRRLEIEAANEEKRKLEIMAEKSREAAEQQRKREKDREIAEALARAANEEKRRLEIEAANEEKRRLEIEAANEEKRRLEMIAKNTREAAERQKEREKKTAANTQISADFSGASSTTTVSQNKSNKKTDNEDEYQPVSVKVVTNPVTPISPKYREAMEAINEMQNLLQRLLGTGSLSGFQSDLGVVMVKVAAAADVLDNGELRILMEENFQILGDLDYIMNFLIEDKYQGVHYSVGKKFAEKYKIPTTRLPSGDYVLTKSDIFNKISEKALNNFVKIKGLVEKVK